MRPAVLNAFSLKLGQWALLMKLCLLSLAVWLGLQSFAHALSSRSQRKLAEFTSQGVFRVCKTLSTCFVVIIVCVLLEPDLLHANASIKEGLSGPSFVPVATISSNQTFVIMEAFNRITLLTVTLFFILQLVIYSFCLIKIREIMVKELSSALKLKLLDNEEHLFDFGLYVGLGGTVLSLICLAMGIVETSLMAAYASTLFGILFAALLKVQHLRPFRGRLLMESEKL